MIFTTIEDLKEKAFKVEEPKKVSFPQWNAVDNIFPKKNPNLKNGFAVNGGRIAFVADDLILRVIPYMDGIVDILKKNGFTHKSIYVPFSNGDGHPLETSEKWRDLLNLVKI